MFLQPIITVIFRIITWFGGYCELTGGKWKLNFPLPPLLTYSRNITTALVAININFSSLILVLLITCFQNMSWKFLQFSFFTRFSCLMLTIFIIFLIFFLFHFNFRSRQCEFNFIMFSYLLYNFLHCMRIIIFFNCKIQKHRMERIIHSIQFYIISFRV